MTKKTIFFDTEDDYEEGATFSINRNGHLIISVAEEKAVDSCNQSFECTATLSKKQGLKLRDWLCKIYE